MNWLRNGYIKIYTILKKNDGISDVLTMIVFVAIVLLAVIASRTTISSIVSDNVTSLKTWVGTKVSEVLN